MKVFTKALVVGVIVIAYLLSERTKKDVRGGIVIDSLRGRVIILSPDGRVKRELKRDWRKGTKFIVSEKGNLVLNIRLLPKEYLSKEFHDRYIRWNYYEVSWVGVASCELEFINKKGETVGRRVYEVHFSSAPGDVTEEGVSADGSRVFF